MPSPSVSVGGGGGGGVPAAMDNTSSWTLDSDGRWTRRSPQDGAPPRSVQRELIPYGSPPSANLLHANRDAWRQGWAAYARKCIEFRRGLPSHVWLPAGAFLEKGRALRRKFPIDSLRIDGTPGRLRAVIDSGLLDGLRELQIPDTGLGAGEVAALAGHAGLASLRRLSLAYSRLGAEAIRTLATSPGEKISLKLRPCL